MSYNFVSLDKLSSMMACPTVLQAAWMTVIMNAVKMHHGKEKKGLDVQIVQ